MPAKHAVKVCAMAGTYVCAAGVSVHASVRVEGLGVGGWGRRRIRYVGMFECRTSASSSLVKCQRPLPSVPPTGSFKEVSPCPPPWHLQLLSFHPPPPPPPPHPTRDAILVTDRDYLNAKVLQTPEKKEKEKTSKPIKPSVSTEQEKEFDAEQLVASRF